jgi:hypothetical protein
MQQLGNAATQVAPSQQQPPRPQSPSQPQYPQPAQPQAPRPNSPSQPGYPSGGLAPSSGAHAPTMMVQGPAPGYQPPQQGYQQPGGYQPPQQGYQQPGGYQPPQQPGGFAGGYQPPQPQAPRPNSPSQPGYGQQPGMGIHSPQVATPQPLPAVTPPYLASQTAARAGRPVEPWKDSLRLWMFIFGGIALAVFAIPLATDPMVFNWDAIIHAPGKEKLPPLIWATTGLLGIVCAAVPMQTLPRGLSAGVLGLAGALVPMLLMGHLGDQWQLVLMAIGAVLLVPGLLVRNEYTDSLTARLMITFGVIFALVPYLVPEHGQIPLVSIFKALIEGQNHMEMIIPAIANIVIVVLCLLAWMPGPATAGAKVFAWILILFPLAATGLKLAGTSHMTDVITKQPGLVLSFVPGIVYAVFLGYGVATVIGKQLE